MACPKCGECDLTFTFDSENFKCKTCEHDWSINDASLGEGVKNEIQ